MIQARENSESGMMELSNAAPKQPTQLYIVASSKLRLAALVDFLTARAKQKERVVVFMSKCDGVDFFTSRSSMRNRLFVLLA